MALNIVPIQTQAFEPTTPLFQKAFQQGLDNFIKVHQARYAPELSKLNLDQANLNLEKTQDELDPKRKLEKVLPLINGLNNHFQTPQNTENKDLNFKDSLSHSIGSLNVNNPDDSAQQGNKKPLFSEDDINSIKKHLITKALGINQKDAQSNNYMERLEAQHNFQMKRDQAKEDAKHREAEYRDQIVKDQIELRHRHNADMVRQKAQNKIETDIRTAQRALAHDMRQAENKKISNDQRAELQLKVAKGKEDLKEMRSFEQSLPVARDQLDDVKEAIRLTEKHPEYYGAGLGGVSQLGGEDSRSRIINEKDYGDLTLKLSDLVKRGAQEVSHKGLALGLSFAIKNKPSLNENQQNALGKLYAIQRKIEREINMGELRYSHLSGEDKKESESDPYGLGL